MVPLRAAEFRQEAVQIKDCHPMLDTARVVRGKNGKRSFLRRPWHQLRRMTRKWNSRDTGNCLCCPQPSFLNGSSADMHRTGVSTPHSAVHV